jgi:hypothetical protein
LLSEISLLAWLIVQLREGWQSFNLFLPSRFENTFFH